jgi:hypothetical protein
MCERAIASIHNSQHLQQEVARSSQTASTLLSPSQAPTHEPPPPTIRCAHHHHCLRDHSTIALQLVEFPQPQQILKSKRYLQPPSALAVHSSSVPSIVAHRLAGHVQPHIFFHIFVLLQMVCTSHPIPTNRALRCRFELERS